MNKHDFFRKLVLNISSSLELSKSLRATYDFLAGEFPIDGISLHRFDPRLRALHIHFVVTRDGFYDLDILIPMSDEDVEYILKIEEPGNLSHVPSCAEQSIAQAHNRAMRDYLPFKDRAYLVTMLATGNEVVGHLCLLGNDVNCFTAEHEQKMELLIAPISLAMVNMLQYRRTKELQRRLDEQRLHLAGEVSMLKETAIIGAKGGMLGTMDIVGQLVGKESPVLILGETGTGKELIADAVQRISPRAQQPYIKVNCGAIPDTLMDSELFGYEKGAFTGALTNKAGRFEQADGGTLFLDEVGELPPQAQVRLLRVLQNGVVDRVGGNKPIPVNVRIIAATNRPLENMLQEGNFREDLFYRLNVFPIKIPPLRERPEDIPLLVHHFIQEASKRLKLSSEIRVDAECMKTLQIYTWPGNVRELENLVERVLTLEPEGPLKLAQYLPPDEGWYLNSDQREDYLKKMVRKEIQEVLKGFDGISAQRSNLPGEQQQPNDILPLDEAVSQHIRKALDQCRGKVNGPGGAAELLKVNPSTLRKRMAKLGIAFGYQKKSQ